MANLSPQLLVQARHKVFLFFLIGIFVIPSFISLPGEEGVSPFTPLPSSGSISSEEENIDDFSVFPSQRWNLTDDFSTDDRIVDDNLRLITVNNETSDSEGFEMNRDLRKTDGKVEWRSKADGSGNQTEYFRDKIGDTSDFEEGDTEGWAAATGNEAVSVSNGIFKDEITNGAATAGGFRDTTKTFETIIWTSVEIKLKAFLQSDDDFKIQITNRVLGAAYSGTTENLPINEWTIITLELDQAAWTGTVSDGIRFFWRGQDTNDVDDGDFLEVAFIKIIGNLDFATHVEGQIGDTFDFEEGDQEGFTGLTAMSAPGGFLKGTLAAGAFDVLISPTGLTIDPLLFNLLVFRMNASETLNFEFFSGATQVSVNPFVINTAMTTYTLDLSDNAIWNGLSVTRLDFLFEDSDGTNEGDEIIFVEYVLLLGSWDNADSVIGLYDNGFGPLLNVSTHFYSNSSIGARFEIELLDLSGEIAYQLFSDNFTDIADLWVRGKITFDSLRSSLIVEMKADNLTRIFKGTFPADFTKVSGRIPALFQLGRTPGILVSTFTPAVSWQELTLGFIRAPFKEREWTQDVQPSDSDWLFQNWDGIRVQDDITAESSNWSLSIPYLDGISGIMRHEILNGNNYGADDQTSMSLIVFGVDADDGELHQLFEIIIIQAKLAGSANTIIQIRDGNGVIKFATLTGVLDKTPIASFSISTSEDRTKITVKVRAIHDETTPSVFNDGLVNFTIADIVDDPSQEFVIQTFYEIELLTGNTETIMLFEDFGFTDRDIFADIIYAIVEPIGNFITQVFVFIFRFFADIFKFVGDLIVLAVSALEPFLTVITTAIANIASDIWTSIGSALDFIVTAITEIAESVATAILAIVDDVISVLITLASSIMDIIAAVIPLLLTFLGTILVDLVDLLADIVFFWWEAMALPDLLAIAELALDFLTELVDWLIITITELIQLALDMSWIILVVWWFICIPVQFGSAGSDPFGGIANAIEFFFGNALPISILGFQLYLPQGLVATAWLILLLPADFALFTALAAV